MIDSGKGMKKYIGWGSNLLFRNYIMDNKSNLYLLKNNLRRMVTEINIYFADVNDGMRVRY